MGVFYLILACRHFIIMTPYHHFYEFVFVAVVLYFITWCLFSITNRLDFLIRLNVTGLSSYLHIYFMRYSCSKKIDFLIFPPFLIIITLIPYADSYGVFMPLHFQFNPFFDQRVAVTKTTPFCLIRLCTILCF